MPILFCDVDLEALPWSTTTWREKSAFLTQVLLKHALREGVKANSAEGRLLVALRDVDWTDESDPQRLLAEYQLKFRDFSLLRRLAWPFAEGARRRAQDDEDDGAGEPRSHSSQQHAGEPTLQQRDAAQPQPEGGPGAAGDDAPPSLRGRGDTVVDVVGVANARVAAFTQRLLEADQCVLPPMLATRVAEQFRILLGNDPTVRGADTEPLARARALLGSGEMRQVAPVPDVTPLPQFKKECDALLAQQLTLRNMVVAHLVVKILDEASDTDLAKFFPVADPEEQARQYRSEYGAALDVLFSDALRSLTARRVDLTVGDNLRNLMHLDESNVVNNSVFREKVTTLLDLQKFQRQISRPGQQQAAPTGTGAQQPRRRGGFSRFRNSRGKAPANNQSNTSNSNSNSNINDNNNNNNNNNSGSSNNNTNNSNSGSGATSSRASGRGRGRGGAARN